LISSRIRKFVKLSSAEKWLVIRALILLQLNWFLVRIKPLEEVINASTSQRLIKQSQLEETRIPELVDSASRLTRWTDNCLLRGLTSKRLLLAAGYRANLGIGVKQDEYGVLCAHAWIERSDGSALTEELVDQREFQRLNIYTKRK